MEPLPERDPMSHTMDEQLEFLKMIATRLDQAGIPYMLSGSVAMAVYSEPRMTRDIDIVVEYRPEDAARLASLFTDNCLVDPDDVEDAARREGMFNVIHREWVMKADFIARKAAPFRQEEFSRRTRVRIEGIEVSVVTPEDLILSKLAWAKDSGPGLQTRDVQVLVSTRTDLDWTYLNRWAAELGVKSVLDEMRAA